MPDEGEVSALCKPNRIDRIATLCQVAPHGRLLVEGPNGCGKSTLLKAVAGLHALDAGEVELCERVGTYLGKVSYTGTAKGPYPGKLFLCVCLSAGTAVGPADLTMAASERKSFFLGVFVFMTMAASERKTRRVDPSGAKVLGEGRQGSSISNDGLGFRVF
jgi:energy-coupling factor transporter ATP-binding protein EcfA2